MSNLLKRLELLEKKSPPKRGVKAYLYAGSKDRDADVIRACREKLPALPDYFIVYRKVEDGIGLVVYNKEAKLIDVLPSEVYVPKLSEEDMLKAREFVVDKIGD